MPRTTSRRKKLHVKMKRRGEKMTPAHYPMNLLASHQSMEYCDDEGGFHFINMLAKNGGVDCWQMNGIFVLFYINTSQEPCTYCKPMLCCQLNSSQSTSSLSLLGQRKNNAISFSHKYQGTPCVSVFNNIYCVIKVVVNAIYFFLKKKILFIYL